METCPTCGSGPLPAGTECERCAAAPSGEAWLAIYQERGFQFDLMEDAFRRAGFTTARKSDDPLWAYPAAVAGAAGMMFSTLYLRRIQSEARREEVHGLLRSLGTTDAADPAAAAEAEEEYDVRACAGCQVFLHSRYEWCPGCGSEVVPAVEIFGEGQLGPEQVIVGDGIEPDALAIQRRLRDAGFHALVTGGQGWSVRGVAVPWSELTGRGAEIDALISTGGIAG